MERHGGAMTFQEWIGTKWLKIDQDNQRMKLFALNADFSNSSVDPSGSRRHAQAGIIEGYHLKMVILLARLA